MNTISSVIGSVSGLSTGEHYATLKQTGPEKQKIHFIEGNNEEIRTLDCRLSSSTPTEVICRMIKS